MKTISVQADAVGILNPSHVLLSSAVGWPRAKGSNPTWLPVPAVPEQGRGVKAAQASRARQNLWLRIDGEVGAEKLLLGALVVAAAVGIAYGFSCMLDLIGNWAGITASIGHMLQ